MDGSERPGLWVGHIALRTADLDASEAFMRDLGMRAIFHGDDVSVLELRGGTHLVLLRDTHAPPEEAGFDLMVEDLRATRQGLLKRGVDVSDIETGRIHDSFQAVEPGGSRITFNSTHVEDYGRV
jgi:catechol 2,3-dioxygenase-like lactoylglutathione lyase family enzyme